MLEGIRHRAGVDGRVHRAEHGLPPIGCVAFGVGHPHARDLVQVREQHSQNHVASADNGSVVLIHSGILTFAPAESTAERDPTKPNTTEGRAAAA